MARKREVLPPTKLL